MYHNIQKCSPEAEQLPPSGTDIQFPQHTSLPTSIFFLFQFSKFSGFKQQLSSYYQELRRCLAKKFWLGISADITVMSGWGSYFCSLGDSSCSLPRWTSLDFLPIWLPQDSLSADCAWGSGVSAPPVM